jgi:carbonic anhydrase
MIEPRIESNKLRLKFKRRPCSSLLDPACLEPDPPSADFPNDWGGYVDLMHVDFKVPSEHTIEGERFDAEMQIFHLHPSRRRTPTLAVVIRARTNGFNSEFQQILDQFQYVYNDHGAKCFAKLRLERRRTTEVRKVLGKLAKNEPDYDTWADFSTAHEDPKWNATVDRRKLQGFFSPHSEVLVPSIHFYGYEGSITEPPCSEFVTWFVSDTPMTIGLNQLEQLKRLLFTHVSPTCEKTSVHYRQSVARPLQDTAGRPVWKCTEADFLADDHRFLDDDAVV